MFKNKFHTLLITSPVIFLLMLSGCGSSSQEPETKQVCQECLPEVENICQICSEEEAGADDEPEELLQIPTAGIGGRKPPPKLVILERPDEVVAEMQDLQPSYPEAVVELIPEAMPLPPPKVALIRTKIKNSLKKRIKKRMPKKIVLKKSGWVPVKMPSSNKPLEIVFDNIVYTLSCGFFNHKFNVPTATNGNFYISIDNILKFKQEYSAYENAFNNYTYECSKPKITKGKPKIIGAEVIREEVAETVNPVSCSKFDFKPVQVSFTKWLGETSRIKLTDKTSKFEQGLLTADDIKLNVTYNGRMLSTMMTKFKVLVDTYNTDKTGDFYKVGQAVQ